ncbi:MAG: type II toxin-antitoxin system VapC family toxin [Proteobacteria bacterium]|nr:type II toxin-antitoxin system VapC family toxin [Pseudomonadota bacterium]
MIAVDTSALMAILLGEPDERQLRAKLETSNRPLISAGTILELQIVTAGKRVARAWRDVEILLEGYRVVIHPFDERQLRIAREAAVTYGKGRHKAGLNFGDCFAYALAKSEALPLLCTGNDFIHTDLKLA